MIDRRETRPVVVHCRRVGKADAARREREARARELRISEILTRHPTLTRAEAERMLEAA